MIKKLKLNELGRLTEQEYMEKKKYPVRLILDNIRSALNVGSCFRTADCCGIEGIDLCGFTAVPPHREISKTAIGTNKTVSWKQFENIQQCIDKRKSENYKIIVLEQTNKSVLLQDWVLERKSEKIALVFGNEVNGVSEVAIQGSDYVLEIPQFGIKHSHNVAVSVGITLWHYLTLQLK